MTSARYAYLHASCEKRDAEVSLIDSKDGSIGHESVQNEASLVGFFEVHSKHLGSTHQNICLNSIEDH